MHQHQAGAREAKCKKEKGKEMAGVREIHIESVSS
jgi:hypothetical protein